jgi:Ca2+-binding EF-hand superfamily protein
MHFAGDNLYIGQGDILGFFTIPVSEIEANIAAQKQTFIAKKHEEDEAKRQLQEKVLARYDHNHNGVIDAEEKEEALDDPDFIESELGEIDTNQNGWLDAEELVWFDANTNKTLEPKEQAGIEITQHLLAERLLKQFDANGDGLLDRTEFNNLQYSVIGTSKPRWELQFVDTNHDGHLDLGELETFLQQQTRSGLPSRPMRDLLAERLLKQFDANGDGLLDRTEFNNLQDSVIGTSESRWELQFVDINHDGHLDLRELETFLQQQTRSGPPSRPMQGSVVLNQMRTNPNQPVDPRQLFKATVESYWQNPVVVTNRPSFNRAPSVGGAVTNGAQSGKP